jgi:hypothetical protein
VLQKNSILIIVSAALFYFILFYYYHLKLQNHIRIVCEIKNEKNEKKTNLIIRMLTYKTFGTLFDLGLQNFLGVL